MRGPLVIALLAGAAAPAAADPLRLPWCAAEGPCAELSLSRFAGRDPERAPGADVDLSAVTAELTAALPLPRRLAAAASISHDLDAGLGDLHAALAWLPIRGPRALAVALGLRHSLHASPAAGEVAPGPGGADVSLAAA